MLVDVRSEQPGVIFQQQPVLHQLLRRFCNRSRAVALVRIALRHRRAWIVGLEPLLARRTHTELVLKAMELQWSAFGVSNELRQTLGLDAELARDAAAKRGARP